MSVKYALLALLSRGPASAYQLRRDFDTTTSETWPLNIGQVSTTLQRLERDGLIARVPATTDTVAEPWQLTEAGRAELDQWWSTPVLAPQRSRDELVIKLAMAAAVPGVDLPNLVQRQRSALQQLLHDITRARHGVTELPALLVLEHHLYTTESELRWLDALEGMVAHARVPATSDAAANRAPASLAGAATTSRSVGGAQ